MYKGTIFRYEIKRLLFSREYPLLLTATAIYSVSLLRGLVIFGANYTAPFSQLTFSTFCSSLIPFLLVLLLVLCARQFKTSERRVEAIISATLMPLDVIRLLRYGAIACAFLIAAVLPITACLVFYRLVFDYTAVGSLLLPGLLQVLPPAILLFGTVMLLSNRSIMSIYVLLAAVLIVSIFHISLPAVLDIIGSSAAQTRDGGAYAFALTPAFITERVAFSAVGIVFMIVSLCHSKKRPIC